MEIAGAVVRAEDVLIGWLRRVLTLATSHSRQEHPHDRRGHEPVAPAHDLASAQPDRSAISPAVSSLEGFRTPAPRPSGAIIMGRQPKT